MSSIATSLRGDAVAEASPSAFEQRRCSSCGEQIPTKRLQALPYASQCVPCLNKAGDVVTTRRFDQLAGTLEEHDIISVYYREPSQYMRKAVAETATKLGMAAHLSSGRVSYPVKQPGFVINRLPNTN